MDKRCGNSWHAVVGEGYGFEVTHEMRNLLYMYFGGNLVSKVLQSVEERGQLRAMIFSI